MSQMEVIQVPEVPPPKKDAHLEKTTKKDDLGAMFLKAARQGNTDKMDEIMKECNIDINVSNANGLNALHLSCKEGNKDVVSYAIKKGADIHALTKKGNTPLHIASLAGHLELVSMLISCGAKVNFQSPNGFTCLYMAAQENHIAVVELLLKNGAQQSLTTEDGFTPLAVSLQQGHDKVVALLLENDASGSKMRLPALHMAAKKNDVKAAKLLLQQNKNSDDKDEGKKCLVNDAVKSGFTPLHICAHYGNCEVAKLLIHNGADVNFKAKNQITPIHISSKWGRMNIVTALLDSKATVDPTTRDGLTPMHCAARSGHNQVVECLLKRGSKVDMKTLNGLTPLHMAIQGDHEACTKLLLAHKSDINETTVDYLTPLHVAAHCGNVKTAKLLLQDKKCQVNARALNGFTPLHIACKKDRIKVVELLLKYGATLEATTESGLTPLHVASFMGHLGIAVHLVQQGSNPNTPTCRGETALHLAARSNQTDVIRVLLRNGAQVQAKSWDDQTALHVSSRLGNVDNVMLLLRHGASPNDVTKDLTTPLHLASREGHEEVVMALLEHAAKIDFSNKKGFTALHLACKNNHNNVVKLLLKKGADANQATKSGLTPIHVATHYNRYNVVETLLGKKADPAKQAKNGYTPLHIAARKNRMNIASLLLEAKVPRNPEIHNGLTPLDLACQQGHVEMTELLLENKASATHKAANGLTALHLTAQEDKVQVAPSLLSHKANINAQTKAGYTPLHTACHFGQMAMVKFLLQNGAKINATTKLGYTPLHHASQQGHTQAIDVLIKNQADPNLFTQNGESAMSIASRLGYVSIVEVLRPITNQNVVESSTAIESKEKYKVVFPEVVHDAGISDSEDEMVEDSMTIFIGKSYDQFPRGYDSLDSMALQQHSSTDKQPSATLEKQQQQKLQQQLNKQHQQHIMANVMKNSHDSDLIVQEEMMYMKRNVQIQSEPMSWECHNEEQNTREKFSTPPPQNFNIWTSFLVSFMVDARGGLFRGCRHSGLRVVVPQKHVMMPLRVMCKLVRRDRISHPPTTLLGEAVTGRILELAPNKLAGPILLDMPHYACLGNNREMVILRSEDGIRWHNHYTPEDGEKMDALINKINELDLQRYDSSKSSPVSHTHIITSDLPKYFALVTRIKMDTSRVPANGCVVSSKVIPQVQLVVSPGAVEENASLGLQTQEVSPALVVKLAGNRVAVGPLINIEPQKKQFQKPVMVTSLLPTPAQKGMINQYTKEVPSSLKLLASYADNNLHWTDITAMTPLKIQKGNAMFNVTQAGRYWLVDCPVKEVEDVANDIFHEVIKAPFLTRFLVFTKRVSHKEACLRLVATVDGEDFDGRKALEQQEHFKEVARSKVVEVQDGKPLCVEMTGNLVPVTKSDETQWLSYNASEDAKIGFYVRIKDHCQSSKGIIALVPFSKQARQESSMPTKPLCCLELVLNEYVSHTSPPGDDDTEEEDEKDEKKEDEKEGHDEKWIENLIDVVDSDEKDHKDKAEFEVIAKSLQSDWLALGKALNLSPEEIEEVENQPEKVRCMAVLKIWSNERKDENELKNALKLIDREDVLTSLKEPTIKKKTTFSVKSSNPEHDYLDKNYDQMRDDIDFASSRGSTLQREMSLDVSYDEHDICKDIRDADVGSHESYEPRHKSEKDTELKHIQNYYDDTNVVPNVDIDAAHNVYGAHDADNDAAHDADNDAAHDADHDAAHVADALISNKSSAEDLSEETFTVTNQESKTESKADGSRLSTVITTITHISKKGNVEKVFKTEVNEDVKVYGMGVKKNYNEEDVDVETFTEQSEQVDENGSLVKERKTVTTIELIKKLRNREDGENKIEAKVLPERLPPRNRIEDEEKDDDYHRYLSEITKDGSVEEERGEAVQEVIVEGVTKEKKTKTVNFDLLKSGEDVGPLISFD